MAISGNIGEWSELYAIFKLLSDGWLDLANADLKVESDLRHSVTSVARIEGAHRVCHEIVGDRVVSAVDGVELMNSPRCDFGVAADAILEKTNSDGAGTFFVAEAWDLASKHGITKLKANSREKADFLVSAVDPRTNIPHQLGYSVKSWLGASPTLLNSSKATNFIYSIRGPINDDLANQLNALTGKQRLRDRLAGLKDAGCELHFIDVEGGVFYLNLQLIDTGMPDVVASMIRTYYEKGISAVTDIADLLEETNPLGLDQSRGHKFYKYKIQQFLRDVALGMQAQSSIWNGEYGAGAGYIVVAPDGAILSFHLYNLNEFQDYLFRGTRLETPSMNRHSFGEIYREGGYFRIKLNIQIRFRRD